LLLKLQAKERSVSQQMFERYDQDTLKISKQSLVNMTKSNGNYGIKASVSQTRAKVLVMFEKMKSE
jgi:hypothetical protein